MRNPSGRNQSVDALKGAGVIGVVLLHIPSSPSTDAVAWQLFDILSRFAVPCFFMISGYFFRKSWEKQVNKIKILTNSTGRIIPAFAFWALIYEIIPPLIGGGNQWTRLQQIFRFPHSFLLTGNVYHLWFLSSLLQAIILLWIALRMNRMSAGLVLGALLFVVCLYGGTYSMTPLGHPIANDLKSGPLMSTLFVFLGAHLAQGQFIVRKHQALALAVSGFIMCLAEAWFLTINYQIKFQGQSVMIGIIPLSLGLMNLALHDCFSTKFLPFLGRYSLGLYVVHPWIIEILKKIDIQFLKITPLLFLIFTTAASLLLTWILSKTPYIRATVV